MGWLRLNCKGIKGVFMSERLGEDLVLRKERAGQQRPRWTLES